MDSETRKKIEETVLEILRNSNFDEATEYKIRNSASEKLQMNLSEPTTKAFVREVVESYLREQLADQNVEEHREEGEQEAEEAEEDAEKPRKSKDTPEYDDVGGRIICRLSDKRMVTISEFRGKTSVSIREYYKKDGKELPGAKGINLNHEQWALLKKNLPEIEKAIHKMESG